MLVLVPPTEGPIGSDQASGVNADFDSMANEAPAHVVAVDAFFLAKYELTQDQWGARRARRDSVLVPAGLRARRLRSSCATSTHPVEQVNRGGATAFAERCGLELPTEAQWELACRAGVAEAWSWGSDVTAAGEHGNFLGRESLGSYNVAVEPEYTDPYVRHAPVGSFAANPLGFFDLHGNVWEWCRDPYASYASPVDPGDPGTGLRADDGSDRGGVIRGGSFSLHARYSRSARRAPVPVDTEAWDVGARLACAVRSGS